MGQALYRKYRSKSLDEIVGQEHITTTLSAALKRGHISHAYLLTGPRGVGKTSVARILAYEVNGLPYDESATHLDIIEIDAASNRRIDEIRDLRDKVHVAPAAAKYKVYIIDEVHMLTREAFNALLKTLEEPPAHAIFILATTEAYKLPETIISRTQRFSFRPIEAAKVVEHLKDIAKKEKIDIDDEALEIIARHGEGSFRDSISLLDQVRGSGQKVTVEAVLEMLGEAPAEQIAALEKSIGQQDGPGIVKNLQTMQKQGYEPARVAKQLGQTLRQNLLNGQSALDYHEALQLLSRLLKVSSSTDPALALEIALLKSVKAPSVKPKIVVTETEIIKKIETKGPKTEASAKPEPKAKPEPIKKPAEDQTPAPAAEAPPDDEIWQNIMDSIKKHHNTLYSVMRMARPSWGEDSLTLSFGFAFHQKRINEARNRQIIAEIVRETTGQEVKVTSILDEALKPAAKPEAAPQIDPAVSSISNIFGGAELVES